MGGARPNNYSISSVQVDGVTMTSPGDYSLSGQTITFTSPPSANADNVVVVLAHAVDTMTQTEVKNRIDSYNIPNLTTSFTQTGAIQRLTLSLKYRPEQSLVLRADLGNGTNTKLDFSATETVVAQDIDLVDAPDILTVQEVRDAINNTSNSLLTYISASVVTNNIVITQTNRTNTSLLIMSGSVLSNLGLAASTPGTSVSVPVPVSYDEAATTRSITSNGITTVTVTGLGNRIKFEFDDFI